MGNTLSTALRVDFGMQAVGFLVAAAMSRTEKFYDLLGSLTYIAVIVRCFPPSHMLRGDKGKRVVSLAMMVCVWAIRLGTFLAKRGFEHGDKRFDKLKPDIRMFGFAWLMQGVWVFLTLLAVLLTFRDLRRSFDKSKKTEHTETSGHLNPRDYVGWSVWALGFAIEVISDYQKTQFSAAGRPGGFISSGLWSYSRHPNYCGEIMCWLGIWLSCSSVLRGKELAASTLSPAFIYYLLTRMSGIPMLERASDKRFGALEAYQAYKTATPVLFPWN